MPNTKEEPGRVQIARLVVWPRGRHEDLPGKPYRYVVVGMIVTPEPLDLKDNNEVILQGTGWGLPEALESMGQFRVDPESGMRTGDATNVLLTLNELPLEPIE